MCRHLLSLCIYKEHFPSLNKAKYLQLNDKGDFQVELLQDIVGIICHHQQV